jgi:hypothetical protein
MPDEKRHFLDGKGLSSLVVSGFAQPLSLYVHGLFCMLLVLEVLALNFEESLGIIY